MKGQEVRTNNVVMRLHFFTKTPPDKLFGDERLAYAKERAWLETDYVDYAGRTGKYSDKAQSKEEKIQETPGKNKGDHLQYVARRGAFAEQKKGGGKDGTGVWNKDGELTGKELKNVAEIFKKTDGIIWSGIISPAKEIGDEKLDSKEKAMDFTKACFERFLTSTHLRADNITWYAGWHDDSASGIKHIQFAFCETKPHLTERGEMKYSRKGAIKKETLADALLNFEEYFSGHRNDYHLARDEFMQTLKSVGRKDVKTETAKTLLDLAYELPKVKGRGGYRHPDYAPYRAKIDALCDRLLVEVPSLRNGYLKVASEIENRRKRFEQTAQGFEKMKPTLASVDELRTDIKARFGNAVIKLANRIRFTTVGAQIRAQYKVLATAQYTMMQERAEKKRIKMQARAVEKKEERAIARMFDEFWTKNVEHDWISEYYADLERIKESIEGHDTSNGENGN